MKGPRISVKATCPALSPKEVPADMETLKLFYKAIDTRLEGIGETMKIARCTKLTIKIEDLDEIEKAKNAN